MSRRHRHGRRRASGPEPNAALTLARYLLDNGCDGLNVLGTTGEATSFSLSQRQRLMSAYKSAGLPLERLMVGTGAAALADAIALTQHAADLGFAGALLLPPFYYKGVPDDGLAAYIAAIVGGDLGPADPALPLSFPRHVGGAVVARPDPAAAREARQPHRRPQGFLRRHALCAGRDRHRARLRGVPVERSGPAGGARRRLRGLHLGDRQLNADLCARAWRAGDHVALDEAVAIRKLFDGKPLVSGVKALLARHSGRHP